MLIRGSFIPFRLHVSGPAHYDITRPELVMIGGAVTVTGIIRSIQSVFFDEPVIVANRQITRLEPLIGTPAAP